MNFCNEINVNKVITEQDSIYNLPDKLWNFVGDRQKGYIPYEKHVYL